MTSRMSLVILSFPSSHEPCGLTDARTFSLLLLLSRHETLSMRDSSQDSSRAKPGNEMTSLSFIILLCWILVTLLLFAFSSSYDSKMNRWTLKHLKTSPSAPTPLKEKRKRKKSLPDSLVKNVLVFTFQSLLRCSSYSCISSFLWLKLFQKLLRAQWKRVSILIWGTIKYFSLFVLIFFLPLS